MSRHPNPEIIQTIKDILYQEIIDKGIDSISMRNIARKAGVTATTIYYYYKDKNSIISQIKRDGFKELADYIFSNDDTGKKVLDRIENILRSFIEWCLKNQNLTVLLFEKLPPELDLDAATLYMYEKPMYFLVDLLQEGQAKGEVDKELNVDLIINWGLSCVYGLVVMIINKRIFSEYWNKPNALINKTIEIIINSIKIK